MQREKTARSETKGGLLTAECKASWIELNFPAAREVPAAPPDGLVKALGSPCRYLGRNDFDYLVELESETAVRRIQPDFTALRKVNARGIIVTSRSDSPEYDFG